MLIRRTRVVPLRPDARTSGGTVDLRIDAGMITDLAPVLAPGPEEQVVDAEGRWLIPGLWDAHVHLGQWAMARSRLDLTGTGGPEEVVARVRGHLAGPARDLDRGRPVLGQGYRSAPWGRQPTVAELDAVSGARPVALTSGDAHNGWLNSAALALLGLPPRQTPLEEDAWFAVLPRLQALADPADSRNAGYRRAVAEAAALGVVGVTDFEFAANVDEWPGRMSDGVDLLRVRAACYPDSLEKVITAGLRTGTLIRGDLPLLTMGPLKIISDGSLNTRTAHCCEPYGGGARLAAPHGVQNVPLDELVRLLTRAHRHGLEVAVHAIGDAAASLALDAYARTGARGSIEHAQLVRAVDVARMGQLPLRASVQPAHLLDDRDVTVQYWADRADRCFPFRSLLASGVPLALGSDAPVSPLDPWLAMAAAVHRSSDERPPWNPGEAITPRQALAASTDGHTVIGVGDPADLVLLDHDPLPPTSVTAEAAAALRSVGVAATIVAGRVTHSTLSTSA